MSAGASLDSPERLPLGIHYPNPPSTFFFLSPQPPNDTKKPLRRQERAQVLPLCVALYWEIN